MTSNPLRVAEALVPLLRQEADETERLRQLSPRAIAALRESDIFRVLQPASYGGSESSYETLLDVLDMLARGCLSTAWVGFNAASHAWMLAMWPKAAQDAIWGESPGAIISSSLIYPAGRAEPSADGKGLVFSGQWAFSSGVDHAEFVMLGAMLQGQGQSPKKVIGLVRKEALKVVDTWHVSGLKGSGSKNIEGEGLFVPGEWIIDGDCLSNCTAPGLAHNLAPVYRIPVFGMFPHLTAAVMIGNAQGCYDEFVQGAAARRTTYSRTPASQLVALQMHVAEAGALIRSASLLVKADAREADAMSMTDEVPQEATQLFWRRNAALAARQATQAVDLLFAAYGGGGNYSSNAAQRRFRDAHAAVSHIQVSWDINAAQYGRYVLTGSSVQ